MKFCVIPWIHRYTDEQGFHRICCIAAGEGNNLKNAAGELMHVSQRLTDAEVLNSPVLKAVRQDMIRGEWPAACERCRIAEEAGSLSPRQHLNNQLGEDQENLLRETSDDGSLERPTVRFADIRLGNVCNLSCRMCGPWASRLWAAHYNNLQPAAYQMAATTLRAFGENNWVKQQPFAWLLDQCLPTVERMHFAGGEPLIIPEMVEALKQCIASGRAGEIELSYNTNLTVLPEKVTELWPYFRTVSLMCSIDGYGKLNDYIRRPSHWGDIDRNLRMLDSHFSDWKIGSVTINTTVQIYNVLEIHELFAYMRGAGFTRIPPITQLSLLFTPRYLSIQGLPARVKDVARERLRAEIERAEVWDRPDLTGAIGSIRSVMKFMDAADTTADLPDFLSFCESSDKAFGDSWRDAAPELAKHLEPALRKGRGRRPSRLSSLVRWITQRVA
jgi:sulfatase maturation enzyme AslB (radical SAM superfamily)